MHKTICYKCGAFVDRNIEICPECGELIFKPDTEIHRLKNNIDAFKHSVSIKLDSFSRQISEFEQKMSLLNSQISDKTAAEQEGVLSEKPKTEADTTLPEEEIIPAVAETEPDKTEKEEILAESYSEQTVPPIEPVASIEQEAIISEDINYETEKTQQITQTEQSEGQTIKQDIQEHIETVPQKVAADQKPLQKPKEPRVSFIDKLKANKELMTVVTETFAPVIQLAEFTKDMYLKSKEKKQLPVFFMTLAGILAMLFGFGYLMQLSTSYLGEYSQFAKILIGFATSFAILFWGIKSEKKGEQYHGFSSALIGLSTALNYMLIYFLSQVPFASSALIGFILILSNTVLAKILAIRYETRTVALISLAGGAFAPFYLSADSSLPLYLFYLWLLTVGGIYLSKRLKWDSLAVVSFTISTIVIELSVFALDFGLSFVIDGLLFHAFAYLFIIYALIRNRSITSSISSRQAGLIAGSIALLIVNLAQLYLSEDDLRPLGYILLANAGVFIISLAVLFKKLQAKLKLLFFIIAASFAGFAVPALFDADYMGVAWLSEALVITYLGFSFNLRSVRNESLVIWAVAIVKIASTASGFYFFEGEHFLTYSFINFLALWIGLIFLWVISYKYKESLNRFESKVLAVLKNLCLLLTYFLIISASFYQPSELSLVICIGSTFPIIYIAYRQKLSLGISVSYLVFFGLNILLFTESWEILKYENDSLFNTGSLGMVLISSFLTGFYFWHKLVFKTPIEKINTAGILKTQGNISSFSAIIFIAIISVFCFKELAALAFLPFLLVSEHLAQKAKFKFSRRIHQLYFYLTFLYAFSLGLLYILDDKGTEAVTLLNIGILPVIWLSKYFSLYILKKRSDAHSHLKLKKEESLFAILLAFSAYAYSYIFLDEYFMAMVPVGMFAYLLYFKKRKLPAAELTIYLQYIALIIVFIVTGVKNGSFRFGLLPLHGKIYFIETAAMLWGIKLLYQKFKVESKGSKTGSVLRDVFYAIVPFSFLSPVNRLFPEYLAIALWGSAFVAFMMNRFLKKKYLLVEFYAAGIIASILSLTDTQNIYSPVAGFVIAALICAIDIKQIEGKRYFNQLKAFSLAWLYYFSIAFGLFSYNLTQQLSTSASIAAISFIAFSLGSQFSIRGFKFNTFVLRYLSYAAALISALWMLNNQAQTVSIITFSVLALIYIADIYKIRSKNINQHKAFGFTLDTILCHLFIIACYANISNKAVFSTLLIIHAISLLFNSIIIRFKNLIWLSIAVFAGALIKLIAYDLQNLSMGEKVFVMIGSGAILLGASFLYVKLREKIQLKQIENNE